MLTVFLLFRNKELLCPSNVVFGSYFLYFIFPSTLFYILEWVDWVYVLPWGKTNDWSKLSDEAILSYAYVFTLFFLFTRLFEVLLARTSASTVLEQYRVNTFMLFVFTSLVLVGGLYFFQVTGGIEAWFGNYSDTYLENKKGYGLLNFLLIMSSNFLAFALGFYWKTARSKSYFLVLFVLVALVFCAYIQGVKSRIFYFTIFFSIPWLTVARLTLLKGAVIFVFFTLAFSFAMYFRSNGFYSTPEMLLEYFLSYFNTIFLHDMILRDMQPDFLLTMGYPMNKWLTFVGIPSEDYMHDISRWLTSIYFPKQWFQGSATQQWPIETELYLNYGNYIFWAVPVFMYSLYICTLYSLRYRLGPVFLFIFTCELLFFLSVFRGSMLQWIALFNIIFYLMLWGGSRLLFVKENVDVR
ncbi:MULTISPECIES: hypothetical protein [unclassified Pseudomonas]|uniref:hypothetical protein n=1 Tax=unclassified Pseudomonas TaxID=196821 RepID=UPI00117A36DC|nr:MULTISPECIES: hypothetical protein [unclassified Pseudomonas]MCU1733982.1 hypothetical protein [Pseudomonas sp. 20P_3.2_Bac4]MCU1742350.1 hypothetical protein [Pseudomonas sp. 20P_3.2_Bac5]